MKMPPLPEHRYSLRTFVCTSSGDVEKFKRIVKSMGGNYQGHMKIDSLNVWNNPTGFGAYLCAYYYHEDIEMEVCT